ncbi:MAG: ice-binding family protein [Sideroxyarcus sp.]|nr:ice-binding family protein [Sideroxyarcus sp.]
MYKSNDIFQPLAWPSTLLMAAILAGCGGTSSSTGVAPVSPAAQVGSVCAGASCVSLGTAANYSILAKTGVSTVPSSVVTGNVGLSPAARGFLTGWSLISEPTDSGFSSAQVVGNLYAADNVGGTTSVSLTTAVGDMQTAYTAAAGKAGGSCPGVGNLGGLTIAPGVYNCANAVTIPTSVTLNGTATDVWVFQFAQGLTQAAATQVTLAGGALPQNVFWQVAGAVDIGTTALMQGVILSQTAINLQAGSTVNGRLLAQTAVTLSQSTVTP